MICIGVLTPHVAAGPEAELPDMAPGQLITRLAPGSVDVVGYASTSTGYAIGFDAETAMLERLAQRCAVLVVSGSVSAVNALRVLGVTRVALVHPPWFDDELSCCGLPGDEFTRWSESVPRPINPA
jgi:maleate cis-trans isomerase